MLDTELGEEESIIMQTFPKDKQMAVAKTLLTIAPEIDAYCEGLLKANAVDIDNSFYGLDATEKVVERIIDKTANLDKLHNLRVRIDRLLESLPKNQGETLRLWFYKRKRAAHLTKKLGASERTVYRYLSAGLNNFAENLDKLGMNRFTFMDLCRNNPWIARAFVLQVS